MLLAGCSFVPDAEWVLVIGRTYSQRPVTALQEPPLAQNSVAAPLPVRLATRMSMNWA